MITSINEYKKYLNENYNLDDFDDIDFLNDLEMSSDVRIPQHVDLVSSINYNNINWKDLNIIDLGGFGDTKFIGVKIPGETNEYNKGIIVDLKNENGLLRIDIMLDNNLQKLGLGYKIYKKVIEQNGHIYSTFNKRVNSDAVPNIWNKLKNDSDIEVYSNNIGEIAIWSKLNNNIKDKLKSKILNIQENYYNKFNENNNLINERLMNVDDDVDFIYNKYFKSDIDIINKTGIVDKNMFSIFRLKTSNLKTPLSKKADIINPCHIIINTDGNYYQPNNATISLSVNHGAVDFIIDEWNGYLNDAVEYLRTQNPTQSNRLMNEFTESRIKGSIHHELTHWIDDTLHNQHIKKRATRASELGIGMNRKGLPINADKIEIQAQIHNIVQLKKQYAEQWDTMTFDDLLQISPTISVVNDQLSGNIKYTWKRNLLKRMYREGLLGKNMI